MVKYSWIKDKVPNNMKYTQVYGVVFDDYGRVLLIHDNGDYRLIGGHPIDGESYEETLRREFIEEINTEIEDIHYLGYLKVEENNEEYAQVRMIAKIKDVHEVRPDPDNGKTYIRVLIDQKSLKRHLAYEGEGGNLMLDDALIEGNKLFNFDHIITKDEII